MYSARGRMSRLSAYCSRACAYVSRGVLRSYRQGIKRQRLYRRAEVEALLRVAPSGRGADATPQRRGPREIPLAESWIRD